MIEIIIAVLGTLLFIIIRFASGRVRSKVLAKSTEINEK
jgi:hypothetical protein